MIDIVRLSGIFERLPDTPGAPCLVSFNGRRFDIAKMDRIFRAVVFDGEEHWATIGGVRVNLSNLGTHYPNAREFHNSVPANNNGYRHAWIHKDGHVVSAGTGHGESAGKVGSYPDDIVKSGVVRASVFSTSFPGGDKMNIQSHGPITLPQLKALRTLHIMSGSPSVSHAITDDNTKPSKSPFGFNSDMSQYEADLKKTGNHPTQQSSMFRRS